MGIDWEVLLIMNKILGTIITICAILILFSLFGPDDIPPPDSWLQAWTNWVGSVVGIVVATRVFWVGTNALKSRFNLP